jgi:hypothetical protein
MINVLIKCPGMIPLDIDLQFHKGVRTINERSSNYESLIASAIAIRRWHRCNVL